MSAGARIPLEQVVEVPTLPDHPGALLHEKMSKSPGAIGMIIFGIALIGGLGYAGSQLVHDLAGTHLASVWPYALLALALLIALAFEFVNGFHDTANAVATVIYTHSLEPHIAVVWSGMWNLIGVLTSNGAVAFTILSLLPVELILQVGKGAGFAMVFSLLIAAIIWNLSTWWFGLPASSSHTLIGSIIGVGVANQLMNPHTGTSGVDWEQAAGVFKVLLISPLVGFGVAALLLLVLKLTVKNKALYQSPRGTEPPPLWIRALLILTCTSVSFGHGSNDGQKGMGLIMLILIGTVPTAYALNHAVGFSQVQNFSADFAPGRADLHPLRLTQRRHRRRPHRAHRLHPHQGIQPEHDVGRPPDGRGNRQRSPPLQVAEQGTVQPAAKRPQRHVRRQ